MVSNSLNVHYYERYINIAFPWLADFSREIPEAEAGAEAPELTSIGQAD
jgi:hypothetical protein